MLFRHSPRALVLWAAAGVAALVAAHSAASDLATLHRRARAVGSEINVLVAARDLPLGTTLTAADVKSSPHFEKRLPASALRARSDAVGRVVSTPVLAGSIVTQRHLAPRDRGGLTGAVPPGMRAVHVLAADGLRPDAGAVVDVLVTFDPSLVPPGSEATVAAVQGALVIAVDDAETAAVTGQVGVTLLVDVEAASRLAYATANGIVTLSLAPPEEARE